MGILSSMYTGITGLQGQGEALAIYGDNIANANTTGFKASRAEFQDIVAKSLKGILGGNQIGRGDGRLPDLLRHLNAHGVKDRTAARPRCRLRPTRKRAHAVRITL